MKATGAWAYKRKNDFTLWVAPKVIVTKKEVQALSGSLLKL